MRGCGVAQTGQFRIDDPSTSTPWKNPGDFHRGFFVNPNGATQFDGSIPIKALAICCFASRRLSFASGTAVAAPIPEQAIA
jgi:hypothetical protein